MESAKETVRVYTDAPVAYDYTYITTEIDPEGGTLKTSRGSKILRVVEIEKERSPGQIMRYGSGLHIAYVKGDFQTHESLRYGHITLKPEFLLQEKYAGWDGEYATSN